MNKIHIIFTKLFYKKKFNLLVDIYRRKLKIPENGFDINKTGFSDIFIKIFFTPGNLLILIEFKMKVKELYGYPDYFKNYLYHYLIFNIINDDQEYKSDIIYFDESLHKYIELIFRNGLYLQIDPNISIKELIDFIKLKSKIIKRLQKKDILNNNKISIQRLRVIKYKERDELILYYSKKSRTYLANEIKKKDKNFEVTLGGRLKYKDSLISKVMLIKGYKVSPENVRKIISQQKKLRK